MIPNLDEITMSIEQLPATEQEGIRPWLEDNEASNCEGDRSEAKAARSEKSLRWLHKNRQKYSGQWVALDGDHLNASGPTAKKVYSKARAEGVAIPFVELVTERQSGTVTGGWLS